MKDADSATVHQTPNIVFITWHDAGRWFGCYGNESVRTPHVDQLAAEGVRFSNMFSACALCSPSRAAIMTGTHGQENGLMFLTFSPQDNRIHRHISHVTQLVHEKGYHTALFGVQHEAAPQHVHEVMDYDEMFNAWPWPEADVSASAFDSWLDTRDEQPFFAQIGFFESHLGTQFYEQDRKSYRFPEPETEDLHIPPYLESNDVGKKTVGILQGYLQRGDEAIGKILESLKTRGLEDNTLVVMGVDHGVGLPRSKASMYDPGISVSWLMRLPGVIPRALVLPAMATHVDVLPTLYGLLGWEKPEQFLGQDFSGQIRDPANQEELNEMIFAQVEEGQRCVRTRDYKFIRNFYPNRMEYHPPVKAELHYDSHQHRTPGRRLSEINVHSAPVELYDLNDDPNEFSNLAGDPEYVAIQKQMDDALWQFLVEHDDFIIHGPARSKHQQAIQDELEQYLREHNGSESV